MPDDGKVKIEASSNRPFVIWVFGYLVGFVCGFLIAATFLIVVAWRADGADVDHIHSSQLNTRPRSLLARELTRFGGADVITWTEVGSRRATLRRDGWTTYAGRRTDTAVTWADGWRAVARYTTLLTRARYWRHDGTLASKQRATWVVLEKDGTRVLVGVAHLPAHIQLGDGFRWGNPHRVRVWRKSVAGLDRVTVRAKRRWHPDRVIVSADWNVDMRRPHWRTYVRSRLGLRLTWVPPLPRAGTHRHGRLIDATLTDGRGRARLLARTAASDHRPYRERIR